MITTSFLNIINNIVPKRKMISFGSFPDYSDNSRALYEYLIGLKDENILSGYKYIWHIDGNPKELNKRFPNDIFVKKKTFKSIFLFMRSSYIISTHGIYNAIRPTKKQKTILLWHGMPLKRIGYLNEQDIKAGISKADYFTVTSPLFQEMFVKIFHVKKEQILITGQPRNDSLFGVEKSIELRIHQYYPRPYIMYLPTYRKSKIRGTVDGVSQVEGDSVFGGSKEEWKVLDEILDSIGQQIIIKPHPMEADHDYKELFTLNNIKVIDDAWMSSHNLTLYQLLSCSYKLITDYSSVYIDYLLCDRPICFYIPDLDSYKDARGFIFNEPLQYLPGKIITEFSEIIDFITDEDGYQDSRRKINEMFNSIREPKASQNVYEQIFKITSVN